jgi:dTDP-4-dehydrorhamnose reductase
VSASSCILVTGHNGQLGWELRRALASIGEIHTIDRAELDLADAAAIRRAVRNLNPQWIVNAAAYTAVDAAEREIEAAMAVNATAPCVLAEEAAAIGARLIHYSTDYVFDGHGHLPYRESDTTGPLSVYGRSKLDGERQALAANPQTWVFRSSWLYAARGRNFLLTMLRLAREQPRLRVVADQIGSPTWVRLVAEATAAFITAQPQSPTPSGVYHLTAQGSTSWHGFASRIIEWGAARGLCPAVPVDAIRTVDYPTAAQRPAWSVLDCGLLEQRAGIRLPHWEAGLRGCLDELVAER